MASLAHISDHLSHVESELAPNHIKGLKHRTDALAAAAELQVRCFTIASSTAIHLESFVFTIQVRCFTIVSSTAEQLESFVFTILGQ